MAPPLAHRRRLSEPEQPQPRFQWRVRVNSLMMDDDGHAPSLADPTSEASDTRRSSREVKAGSSRYDDPSDGYKDVERGEISAAHARRLDESMSLSARRDRLARTRSEGHIKLRVRLSKMAEDSDESGDEGRGRVGGKMAASSQSSNSHTDAKFSAGDEGARHGILDTFEAGDNSVKDVSFETVESACGGSRDDHQERSPDSGVGLESMACSRGHVEHVTSPERHFQDMESSPGNQKIRDIKPLNSSATSVGTENSGDSGHLPALSQKMENRTVSNDDFQHLRGVQRPETETCAGAFLHDNQRAGQGPEGESSSVDEMLEPMRCIDNLEDDCAKDREEHGAMGGWHIPEDEQETSADDYLSGHHNEGFNPTHPWGQPIPPIATSYGSRLDNSNIEKMVEQMIAAEQGAGDTSRLLASSLQYFSDDEILTIQSEMKKLQHRIHECNEECDNPDDAATDDSNCGTRAVCQSFPSGPQRENDAEDEEEAWADLPVILLEDVFTMLTPKERHQASQVCHQWYELFYSPRVWETFILMEKTLTRKRFNLYKGYQRELCPGKTQLCFRRVGSYFKRIVVTPITDYFNLYEFLRILASFLEFQEEHGLSAMPLLHTFDFTFACASRDTSGILIHGTGGQILAMIKQLLVRMNDLKHLKLNQLLLDTAEVNGLFGDIARCFGDSLSSLEVLNVTKIPFPLTELSQFNNLIKLSISPQHIDEEVLILVSGTGLLHLHLIQDPYTCPCEPVPWEAWKLLREMAPWLRVYLEVSGLTRARVLVQPRAPVYGIFMRTPYSRLDNQLVMELVEHYSKTLTYFVQERLPRVHGPRGFEARCDSSLLFLVRLCPSLHTLVVRERLSTSTLILLANEGKRLSTLLVRRNALIKRCDWSKRGEWPHDFYTRLREAALDYDRCTEEICTVLRRRWRPLSDKQFMRLKIVPKLQTF